MIKDMPMGEFLDALASKAPTPGGGGAAALMGAAGAALVSMVCNLTLGKKAYAEVEGEMRAALEKSENVRARLIDMAQADAEVFGQVMAAYGLPKETEEQKQARAEAIQAALKTATDVPLACARACAEVIELSQAAAAKGNKNVVSDAGVAVLAAHGALRSAALNVRVNASAIQDEGFVRARLGELDALLAEMAGRAEEIHRLAQSRL
jgi:formiminotetrahydrofolate cyclodeaminase